ncbi:hypothetical protein E1193_00485 [Micromonospora sp. KC606]|uniref:hypothetical protein n=1 Tax=Micromonospora sp. KC606 TaxID=2530379 RepID=UPI001042CC2D|nr:hypothetical protein [Micromonospora sp. KC606]TDC86178.1 hypothetical protein E1193_00485 [Micromonospora sp. KC606]
MTATLLAHAGHLAPHNGAEAFIGAALLFMGAATALWRARRQDNRRRRSRDDDLYLGISSGPHR